MRKVQQLTVLTANQCTARCAHCSVNSGPDRKEKLSFAVIQSAIDRLSLQGKLLSVVFAGGEPTLLKEHLLDAIAYCDANDISTRIVTNASWATSRAAARRMLVQLREAGLRELNISADDYHLPFIPFERVQTAWAAAKGMGFVSVSIANCSGPRSIVTPEFIKVRLGEDVVMRFDDEGHSSSNPTLPSEDGTLYRLSNGTLMALGRGRNELAAEDFHYPADQSILDTPCQWAISSAALSPKGHLVACCGTEAHGNPVLDFGDTTIESDMVKLVDGANADPVVNLIGTVGPYQIMRFLKRRAPEVSFSPAYTSMCHICEDIVHRPEALAKLRSLKSEFPMLIAQRRRERRAKAGDDLIDQIVDFYTASSQERTADPQAKAATV